MNQYKLIACDLDGTLIGSDMNLSEKNRKAIQELFDRGVMVVPISGRTLCEMKDVSELPEVRYVIYSNGAAIYDKVTGENIFLGLDDATTRFVFDVLEPLDALTVLHKDGQTYADAEKMQNPEHYHLSFNVDCMLKRYCVADRQFNERFLSGGLESVAAFFATQEDQKKCFDAIASNPDLYAAESWSCNLEIFYKTAGKGNALKYLAEKLGLPMSEVIAIGDSYNDLDMIEAAGLGLAAQNACDALKTAADQVICSNDEHVIHYVKEYILK